MAAWRIAFPLPARAKVFANYAESVWARFETAKGAVPHFSIEHETKT